MVASAAFGQVAEQGQELEGAHVRIGLPAQSPLAQQAPSPGSSPEGFLVDLWLSVAEAEGLQAEFRVGDAEELEQWLQAGEIDVFGGMMLGAGDRGLVLAPPVAVMCHGLFSTGAPMALDRWRGQRVAMTPDAYRAGLLNRFGAEIVPVPGADAAVQELQARRVDLIVGPSQTVALALQEQGVVGESRELHCPWLVPAALPGREDLLLTLSRGFEVLDRRQLRVLNERWQAPSAPSLLPPEISVSPEELEWLADHPSVHLGASMWVPMTEIKEDGTWSGLGLEIVRAIFRKTGVLVTFGGENDWLKVVSDAKTGVYDGLGYTRADDAKREYLQFSSPVVSPRYVIANRIDAPFLRDLDDLSGARLAVIKHYAIFGLLEQNHPEIELVPVDNAQEGLGLLSEGGVEAYMDILPAVTQMTNRLGLKNIKLATRLQLSSGMSIGVRKEWTPLVGLLERAIQVTGEAELQRIYETWDTVRVERAPSRKEVWRAAAGLASPLLVLLAALGVRMSQQRRRAKKSKERLQRQVLHLQKLEALGTLGKGVSHEFNNILQAILGYADLAADSGDEAERRRSLGRIVLSANRAQDIVGQILSFSQRRSIERHPVDLALALEQVSRLLRASLPAQVEISLEVGQRPCFVLGEPGQIKQILMNLATNASEAMPEGGRLEIHLDAAEDENGIEVTTGRLAAGSYWRLAVCDEGVGIDIEIQAKIFDPFFSTRELGEGSGLGLSVVHGIVMAYGGGIRVVSAPGHGACFEVFLPAAEAAAERSQPLPIPGAVAEQERRRILVVDDEVFLTDIVERWLKVKGFDPRVFNDSESAWRAFADDPSDYDLILSDMNMPGLTGKQLAEKACSLRPDIPILIMTGYSSRMLSEGLQSGMFRRVIEKPVRLEELVNALYEELSAGLLEN